MGVCDRRAQYPRIQFVENISELSQARTSISWKGEEAHPDYDRLYEIPDLYEQVVYSGANRDGRGRAQVHGVSVPERELRILDFGAGTRS